MDKVRIGIPRGLSYYYFHDLWISFFKELNISIVISPPTNKEIIEDGIKVATDEMCLSLKIYLGHVSYLKDKCDYILVPRIDNYGTYNQTCTNFLAVYDLVHNLFKTKVLDYNIDLNHQMTEFDGLYEVAHKLGKKRSDIIKAYEKAKKDEEKIKNKIIYLNNRKLLSKKKKILVISHSYNLYDQYIGKPVIDYLQKLGSEVLLSSEFDSNKTRSLAQYLSSNLYFKYAKESIGSIVLAHHYIDGIIFLSSFPCGIDSLVNELVMRKISIPYLNLIIDDMDGMAGIKTRLESFMDILEQV